MAAAWQMVVFVRYVVLQGELFGVERVVILSAAQECPRGEMGLGRAGA